MDEAQDLKGKVAVISGGAGAIGTATARRLARGGATVVIADLAAAEPQGRAQQLQGEGLDVVGHELDLGSEASIQALMAFVAERFGRLDVLDNNAAMKGLREDRDVLNMPTELWDQVFATNARGTMLMIKHALPTMLKNGGGSIVNISSGTSVCGDMMNTAYATSKAAINALTLYVATQYGLQGVRCNALLVGSVLTGPMQRNLPAPLRDVIQAHKLTGRLGQPEDIAEVVAFLAADRSNWITGQLWSVDGGFFAHAPTSPQFAALMKQG